MCPNITLVMTMADYKKMYLTLFRATEDAANILIAAQRECEEMYLNAPEPELEFVPPTGDGDGSHLEM